MGDDVRLRDRGPLEARGEHGAHEPRPPVRRRQPAGHALVAMVLGLALWTVMVAPRLEQAAEAAPFGVRRTVSLAVLRPIAAVSEAVGLGGLDEAVDRFLGREASEVAQPQPALPALPSPEPLPSGEPAQGIALDPLRAPTPSEKLRVAVVGDSFSVGLAGALGAGFDPDLVHVLPEGRLATGLARPDAFDWPARVARIARTFRPDVLVMMIGSNDAQSISYPNGEVIAPFTHEWTEAYRGEVDEAITAATSAGTRVVWVGLPPMKDGFRQGWARRLNAHYEAAAARFAGALYVDSFERFGTASGDYRAYVRDGQGQIQLVRAADGVHFTPEGYRMLATLVIGRMRAVWRLDERAIG